MPTTAEGILKALETVPSSFPSPGGVVAVVKDGKLAGQKVWGYADLEKRIEMTTETPIPICSITKQFLCMLLVDLQRNPPASLPEGKGTFREQLSLTLRQVLGDEVSDVTGLTVQDLCNMQSGMRDYYALSVLWGARPGGPFSLSDKNEARDKMLSFMFEPGTQYSYCNTNFHLLARLTEQVTNTPLGELFDERLFAVAGMKTATLCPSTANHPGPCVGYEGNNTIGFIPACNNMEWSGDAGIVASLSDMIAYETYVDRNWSDPFSLYRKISEPQVFRDGNPATYGNGLFHRSVQSGTNRVEYTGHGGALPGFRLQRLYVPSERLSVIVMFNHEGDADEAAASLLKRILGYPDIGTSQSTTDTPLVGSYLDPVSHLAIRLVPGQGDKLDLHYSEDVETLRITQPGRAESQTTVVVKEGDNSLCVRQLAENSVIHARLLAAPKPSLDAAQYIGRYRCDELESTFHCTGYAPALYGAFDGFLGTGPVHLIRPVADDVWALQCPRALDAPAPGDWTLVFHRDDAGSVSAVTIGCWLARNLVFRKL